MVWVVESLFLNVIFLNYILFFHLKVVSKKTINVVTLNFAWSYVTNQSDNYYKYLKRTQK